MTGATDITASDQTRARLLDAARGVFAQHGFQGATIREICRRAEANVAAVNYHFGSKDGLLAEALNFAPLKALQQANARAGDCPELRLRLFIRDFMLMLLDENNASTQCRIMARELADPTPALDQIVREAIAPLHEFLGELVREIAEKKTGEAELRRCVLSIFGQCLFYRHSHPVLQRLHPEMRYDDREIEAIARHIAEFSLAGIRHSAGAAR
ncbi:MAG: CerR family C-terminal domain-containing protein [Nitrosomonadales bacterium]|nr:CerR family C-terminal domain-containing protein [Nitrosomonadales bacterium]